MEMLGLSVGVIEVGQEGTATTAFLTEGVLMNETDMHGQSMLLFRSLPTPPYHLCRCSALHQYIIYTDTLLCKEGKHNGSEQITTQMAGRHQPPCDAMYACMGAIEKA